jgi:hypothetical protein
MNMGGLRNVPEHDMEFFLGAEPGMGPRAPRREKRLVRFVHPSGLTAHELVLARQKELDAMSIRPVRSTAEEFGLRPPKMTTPRDRKQGNGTPRDALYFERRRRVLDIHYINAESILSNRPSGVCVFVSVLACVHDLNWHTPANFYITAADW